MITIQALFSAHLLACPKVLEQPAPVSSCLGHLASFRSSLLHNWLKLPLAASPRPEWPSSSGRSHSSRLSFCARAIKQSPYSICFEPLRIFSSSSPSSSSVSFVRGIFRSCLHQHIKTLVWFTGFSLCLLLYILCCFAVLGLAGKHSLHPEGYLEK